MPKTEQDEIPKMTFTDAQFERLAEIFQSYVKVKALNAVKTSTKSEIEKSIWILTTAKFEQQKEITKILHVSDHTIRDVLKGKRLKAGDSEVGQ